MVTSLVFNIHNNDFRWTTVKNPKIYKKKRSTIMNNNRHPSGDSDKSNSGRITPDVPADKGVRVKNLENSILKNLPKYNQNSDKNPDKNNSEQNPDKIPFEANAKCEAYDYGSGKSEKTGELQYDWWKCTAC